MAYQTQAYTFDLSAIPIFGPLLFTEAVQSSTTFRLAHGVIHITKLVRSESAFEIRLEQIISKLS